MLGDNYFSRPWVTVCRSESMAAIKRGVQAALFRLGRVSQFHQTDNSTAATHDLPSGKRDFNQDYRDFVGHFGMKPSTSSRDRAIRMVMLRRSMVP